MPVARLARQVPALRRRQPVLELPQDAQPLPRLRAGAGAVPRRRRAGVLHDLCSRPHRRAARPGARALRRPATPLGSCGIVASTIRCPCTFPAPSNKRRRHCAPVGAPDSRSQAFDDRELRPLSLKTWPPADGLCYVAPLLGMEVSLIPFLVKAVPRAAAALVASSLVVSC